MRSTCQTNINRHSYVAPFKEVSVRSSWLAVPRPKADAALRLLCIPHAGGGASFFHPLAAMLPPSCELAIAQLPGREARLAEPPFTRLAPLVSALVDAATPALRPPYAIFGHSMGALIGFEMAREMRRRGLPLPRRLIVSGRRAPTLPPSGPPLHALPDDAFIAELVRRYDAIPQAILQEPELVALFLPVLKADFAVFETHRHQPEPPLACALSTYGGTEDPQTAEMAGWEALAEGPVRRRRFPGGHFYLAASRPALAAALAEDVLDPVPAA